MSQKLRLNWIIFASSVFLFGAILLLLSRKENLDAIFAVWHQTDPDMFCIAVIAMLLVQAITALRLKVLTAAERLHSVGYLPLYRIQLISQFIGYGAPISALSDLAKAAMVKLRFNLPIGLSIRLILYERICGALGAVVIGLIATLCQLTVGTPATLVEVQFVVWAAGLLGGAAILVIGGLHIRSGFEPLDKAVGSMILLGNILRRPAVVSRLVLVSFAQIIGFAVVFAVLVQGMHIPASPLYVLLFMPFIFLISSLPIFYQGWGGREAVVILTIGGLGTVSSIQSIALSIAFGVVAALSSIPGALFWIMRPSMRKFDRLDLEQI
jgi:hypothetical protein